MKDYLTKTEADLKNLLNEKRATLRAFRFGSTGAKSKNVKEGRDLRTEIARIMTAIKAKTATASN